VETGVPLDGSVVNFGKAISTSSLAAYAGRMYEARLYNSPLNTANLTYLYNAKAASVGYSAMGGISTSPGSPFLFLDPANPNPTEFPSLGTAAHCEVVGSTLLRIHGEGSAAVEMPYGATELTFNFKLSDAPSSTDKYVIATFGSASTPLRLYIDSTNPAALYANGQLVATFDDPTNFNEITVVVSTNKITVGTFEQYFSGKPRCYLGSALPEGLLAVSKTIDYDVSTMTAVSAEST
jgi:hypothetical protein